MIKRIFRGVTVIQVVSLFVFAALLASVLGFGLLLLQDRDRVVSNNDRLIEIYDDLYRQSQAQGIDPTTPDPSSVKNDSESGSLVGPRGETGASGQAGRAPTSAEILAAVRSYCTTGTACMGERGQAGAKGDKGDTGAASTIPGPTGQAGAAGKDSTVPGPVGPQGATGATGPAGADSTVPGPAGPTGATGPAGQNGAPGASVLRISCTGTTLVFYGEGDSQLGTVPNSQACATAAPQLPTG